LPCMFINPLWLSHPSFIQLCGITASSMIHGAVFHDGACRVRFCRVTLRPTCAELSLDLIPFEHFLALHRHSPILTVYIYGYCVCLSII
jgi:hypothetical protein